MWVNNPFKTLGISLDNPSAFLGFSLSLQRSTCSSLFPVDFTITGIRKLIILYYEERVQNKHERRDYTEIFWSVTNSRGFTAEFTAFTKCLNLRRRREIYRSCGQNFKQNVVYASETQFTCLLGSLNPHERETLGLRQKMSDSLLLHEFPLICCWLPRQN